MKIRSATLTLYVGLYTAAVEAVFTTATKLKNLKLAHFYLKLELMHG
jgi:hypothetical protein